MNDNLTTNASNEAESPAFLVGAVSKSLNCGMVTQQTRLASACRRFQFEVVKSLGIFWLIEKTPWLKIKEPWDKFYQRTKR